MCTVNELKGHISRALNAVFIATGGAELGMAAERDKFKFTTVSTAIHGTAVRRVATVNHLVNIFQNNGTWMKRVFNFFVVFFKNFLEDVHKTIMKEWKAESNPPLKIEGQGS